MRTLKFVNHDAAIQFDLTVPKEAAIPGEKKPPAADTKDAKAPDGDTEEDDPQQRGGGRGAAILRPPPHKTLTFEYELERR